MTPNTIENNLLNRSISRADITTTRIVIVGASPYGLLTTINLLRRNLDDLTSLWKPTIYHVTLVDSGTDYGSMTDEQLKEQENDLCRLTAHGLGVLNAVPNLMENYVLPLATKNTCTTQQFLPGILQSMFEFEDERYCIDRNCLSGALSRYMDDHFAQNEFLVRRYTTRALFVDSENKQLLVRAATDDEKSKTGPSNTTSNIETLNYDYVLGCDGVRSVVRNAFLTEHNDFTMDINEGYGIGKSILVKRPESAEEGRCFWLANCLPNVTCRILPATSGMVNFVAFYGYNRPCDAELKSENPERLTKYFLKNFKGGGIDLDWAEVGKKWAETTWSSTSTVRCSRYHSNKLGALLMGDAAHATAPTIGQGLNQALMDAHILEELLTSYNDEWVNVLPEYSNERVKEGHALVELSLHAGSSLSKRMAMELFIRQTARRFLNERVPDWLVEKEPLRELTAGAVKPSEVYNKMVQFGYMSKSRSLNEEIMRERFEKRIGMTSNK